MVEVFGTRNLRKKGAFALKALLGLFVCVPHFATAEATYELYPIALPEALVDAGGQTLYTRVSADGGPTGFSWLSWDGGNDTPSLAAALTPPGTATRYVNPDDPTDQTLDPGDWVLGAPGVKSARSVREALDAPCSGAPSRCRPGTTCAGAVKASATTAGTITTTTAVGGVLQRGLFEG